MRVPVASPVCRRQRLVRAEGLSGSHTLPWKLSLFTQAPVAETQRIAHSEEKCTNWPSALQLLMAGGWGCFVLKLSFIPIQPWDTWQGLGAIPSTPKEGTCQGPPQGVCDSPVTPLIAQRVRRILRFCRGGI